MKYNKLYIDLSNLYHRAYHTSSNLSVKLDDGIEIITGGIYTSIKMIQRLEKDFLLPNGEIFFIFDNVHSGEDRRKLIDPDYKANRILKDKSFYRGMDFLNLILMNYKDNYVIVKRPGSEADDLVSTLLEGNKNKFCLLVSNDMDWFRSIDENIHVAKYENKNYTIYDKEKFLNSFGFEPTNNKICMYKAFRGDSADNIPKGVKGIRENILIHIIESYDSLMDLFKNIQDDELIPASWKEKILDSRSRLLLNFKLVSFDSISWEELQDYIFISKFSPKTLRSLYKSLNFKISSFDPRIMQSFPEKKNNGSFFQYETIPRE